LWRPPAQLVSLVCLRAISKICLRIFMKFWMGTTSDWQSVDFCDDRDIDADTGLLEGTFTDVERGQFYEVCL